MKKFLILLLFLVFTNSALAQIQITEVMYDLDGSDSGREWIEIYNAGSEDIDLSNWKLFENNTNHALVSDSMSIISAGGYGIIADNKTKFLTDYPNFSGLLFDSSFALNNTGETISIRDLNLSDVDSVTYSSEMGASGDGNSLQKINNVWVSALPTVGNIGINNSSPQVVEQQQESISNDASIWISDNNKIYANAGKDKTVIVGAGAFFNGEAIGVKKEPLANARFIWNFGDGSVKEGQNILHNFRYPGKYIVFLDVSSGAYSSSDRIVVTAVPSNLSISSVRFGNNSYIELYNNSNRELDISFWYLRSGNNHFTIPQNTYILPQKKIIFEERVTNLKVINGIDVALLYPNGDIEYSFNKSSTQKNRYTPKVPKKESRVMGYKKDIKITPDIKVNKENINNGTSTYSSVLGASVSMIDDSKENKSLYKWLTVLIGLIFLSVGGVLFLRSDESSNDNIDVDEIEILD